MMLIDGAMEHPFRHFFSRGLPRPVIGVDNEAGRALLLLHFELLDEHSQVRRHWGREGVVVVL
jgi:hypothetical protein